MNIHPSNATYIAKYMTQDAIKSTQEANNNNRKKDNPSLQQRKQYPEQQEGDGENSTFVIYA